MNVLLKGRELIYRIAYPRKRELELGRRVKGCCHAFRYGLRHGKSWDPDIPKPHGIDIPERLFLHRDMVGCYPEQL